MRQKPPANPCVGLTDHKVKFFNSANGPLRTNKLKRDPGMSGRQWKKQRKADRKKWKPA